MKIINNIDVNLGKSVSNCPLIEITKETKLQVINHFEKMVNMGLEEYDKIYYIAVVLYPTYLEELYNNVNSI